MRVGAPSAAQLFEPAEQTPAGFSRAIPRKRNLHSTAIFQSDCLQAGTTANTLRNDHREAMDAVEAAADSVCTDKQY